MARHRRNLLAHAEGRVLEIGAGTGLNLRHYQDSIEELVLTEPVEPMASKLEWRVERSGSLFAGSPGDGRGAAVRRPLVRHRRLDNGALHRRRPCASAERDCARPAAGRAAAVHRAHAVGYGAVGTLAGSARAAVGLLRVWLSLGPAHARTDRTEPPTHRGVCARELARHAAARRPLTIGWARVSPAVGAELAPEFTGSSRDEAFAVIERRWGLRLRQSVRAFDVDQAHAGGGAGSVRRAVAPPRGCYGSGDPLLLDCDRADRLCRGGCRGCTCAARLVGQPPGTGLGARGLPSFRRGACRPAPRDPLRPVGDRALRSQAEKAGTAACTASSRHWRLWWALRSSNASPCSGSRAEPAWLPPSPRVTRAPSRRWCSTGVTPGAPRWPRPRCATRCWALCAHIGGSARGYWPTCFCPMQAPRSSRPSPASSARRHRRRPQPRIWRSSTRSTWLPSSRGSTHQPSCSIVVRIAPSHSSSVASSRPRFRMPVSSPWRAAITPWRGDAAAIAAAVGEFLDGDAGAGAQLQARRRGRSRRARRASCTQRPGARGAQARGRGAQRR